MPLLTRRCLKAIPDAVKFLQLVACCIGQCTWCPQCKLPFSSMLTFRTLDGNLHDYPCKESIGLLKQAHWFQDHLKVQTVIASSGRM